MAAIAVGGEARFRQLPLQGLEIPEDARILDLCCGGGEATRYLAARSADITGLDASPVALARAQKRIRGAKFIEGLAEELPFNDSEFDLVHTSAALHEMRPPQLQEILQQVHRVLKPGGIFALVDFHRPTNWLFWPGLALFLGLFETETSWQLLETDLVAKLQEVGFSRCKQSFHAGGSLQVIQAQKTVRSS